MQWRQETFDSCMATIQKLHDQTVSSGIQHALAEATIARLMVGDLSETVREVFLLAFLEWQMEQESEEVAATKSEESQLRETVKRVAQAVETGLKQGVEASKRMETTRVELNRLLREATRDASLRLELQSVKEVNERLATQLRECEEKAREGRTSGLEPVAEAMEEVNESQEGASEATKENRTDMAAVHVAQPVEATQSEVAQPVEATQSEAAQPVEATQSEVAQPVEATQSEAAQPVEATQSEAAHPVEATQSEAAQPVEATQSEAAQPVEATQSEVAQPVEATQSVETSQSTEAAKPVEPTSVESTQPTEATQPTPPTSLKQPQASNTASPTKRPQTNPIMPPEKQVHVDATPSLTLPILKFRLRYAYKKYLPKKMKMLGSLFRKINHYTKTPDAIFEDLCKLCE